MNKKEMEDLARDFETLVKNIELLIIRLKK
jgi:hypothetical protein